LVLTGPEEVETSVFELPPVKVMDAPLVLTTEPEVLTIDELVLTIEPDVGCIGDRDDELVCVRQLWSLILSLLVKGIVAEVVFNGEELVMTTLDGLFAHSFIIRLLSFHQLVKPILQLYRNLENIGLHPQYCFFIH
jgi:hypothetical protein